jgi:hypothetical protein
VAGKGALSGVEAAVRRFENALTGKSPASQLRVTIYDDSKARGKGLDRIFDAFDITMREIPEVLASIVPTVHDAHRRNFATEGSAGRGKWAPLAPSTLAERQRLGFGSGPILNRTGALEAHVVGTPARITRRGNVVELRIEPDVNVGGVPKYRALAVGNPSTNLPGRPMVTVGPASATKITSALQRALRAHAAARGL